jgi:hypothetical protein
MCTFAWRRSRKKRVLDLQEVSKCGLVGVQLTDEVGPRCRKTVVLLIEVSYLTAWDTYHW